MLEPPVDLTTRLPGRVTFRRLSADDAAAFAAHVSSDLDRLRTHLPWPDVTSTPEGAAEWLRAYDRQEDGRVGVGGMWHDGELLGGALLFHHDTGFATVELGCWVVAAGEGAGVVSAACRVLLAHARTDLRVERVEWHAASATCDRGSSPSGSASATRARCGPTTCCAASGSTPTSLSLVGTELDAFVTG